jgi:2-dehydropantoate 2-reductase
MVNRRYAIIGTGAVGGFYGARLQLAGIEVHYLLHHDYDHVRKHGLIVESVEGDFVLPQVYAYQDAEKIPSCDVAVVALKTTQNHLLSKLLPCLGQSNNAVLVLQNGLNIESEIAKIIPSATVIGGLCFLCSNKVGPGHIRHLDYGQIALGEYTLNDCAAGMTESMREIAHDFEAAGIPMQLEPDLLLSRWRKLVWNIPFNGLSVVLNAHTNELIAHPSTRALVESLMHEVIDTGKGYNRTIPIDFLETILAYTEKMKPYRTSMKIDYDENRPMEIETMFGNPLRAAQQAGVSTPKIEMLYRQLKFLSKRGSDA